MEKGLVSIVIPCYNAEKFLNDVFLSLKQQTYQNFEAIFVDDGSKDNTAKILDDFANSFPKAKVIHKQNCGLSSARNCGIGRATGEYLYFLDSDDVIHPETFKLMIYYITKYNADVIIFPWKKISETYTYKNSFSSFKAKNVLFKENKDDIYSFFLANLYTKSACCKFARIDIYKKISSYPKVFDEGVFYAEDLNFYSSFFLYVSKMIYVDFPFYYYRRVSSSMMHSPLKESDLSSLKTFDIFDEHIDSKNYPISFNYVKSAKCLLAMDLLYKFRNSNYENPTMAKNYLNIILKI